jgi:hypothetical protein
MVLNPQRPGGRKMLRVGTTRAPALTSEFKLRRHRESKNGFPVNRNGKFLDFGGVVC